MKTVVLLSGGVDSAVCLAQAVADSDECHAIHVTYGQRSSQRERHAASNLAYYYKVPIVIMQTLLRGSPLVDTRSDGIPRGRSKSEILASGVAPTYVPGRNLVLIALANAVREEIGGDRILFGPNKDDAMGYPDCRPNFIALVQPLSRVETPLLYRTKVEVRRLAKELRVPLELTWSCYVGDEEPCGSCDACVLRAG